MPAGNVVYFYVREEEKNPAVFKRREGKKRMGSKNNGAHTVRLVPYLLLCLEQAIPQQPLCVFFFLLIPLPLLLLVFFLPSSTVFLGEQQGLVALAALHSSTSLRLQITHFCHHCYSRKFGEVKGHHFSLLSSVSSITLAGQCARTHPADVIRFNKRKHFLSPNAESFSHF